jgi:DnaJ-class molecular chaperone
MFKNYYQILGVDKSASLLEIKNAFRKKAHQWHPDKNKGTDTTIQMQEINEAYLILKDTEARERYDIEYDRYMAFSQKKTNEEYSIKDDTLNTWMRNAEKQSVTIVDEMLEDLQGMLKSGFQNTKSMIYVIIFVMIISIIFSIIYL